MYENRRQKIEVLRGMLENERSTFLPQWRDNADYILPRRPQFTVTDSNRGERRNQKIIDATATLAARTLRSGMMGGITSPARPWFRLSTPDPALAESSAAKIWLDIVTTRMTTVFLRSNLYNALPIVYGDMGTFGTAAMAIEEDFENVIRCYPFPIGSYCIATDDRQKVDVFFREFRYTVRQLVQKFGMGPDGKIDWSKFSVTVKNHYDNKQMDIWITVCHVIQPNLDYNQKSLTSKKYESVYYEKGQGSATAMGAETYLRDSGFDYFPVLAPRWEVTGEDVYGTECPGNIAIGDIKALQIMQKRKAQAIEKMVNPPMIGPSTLRTQKASILPGDITYVDEREGQKGFRPAHEVNFRIEALTADIQEIQQRIRRTYYEDLFLTLTNSDRRMITAREIDERHEEKLLALGPVLEQLNQDLLDPLIDISFNIMAKQGFIPPPPPELNGHVLKVEYISIMHQAQKLAGLVGIEKLAQFAGQVAQFKPEVLDKIDGDQMVDEYADIIGTPPRIIVSDDQVMQVRAQRQQAQAQQAQQAQIAQTAKTAKDLSAADLSGNNALSALANQAAAGGSMLPPTVPQ